MYQMDDVGFGKFMSDARAAEIASQGGLAKVLSSYVPSRGSAAANLRNIAIQAARARAVPKDIQSAEQTASATQTLFNGGWGGQPVIVPNIPFTGAGVRPTGAQPLFMLGSFPVTPMTAAAGLGGAFLLFRLLAKK